MESVALTTTATFRSPGAAHGVRAAAIRGCRDWQAAFSSLPRRFHRFHDMLAPVIVDGARGVVHCFTGNRVEAEAFLPMGLDIGITGWVTDLHRGHALREALPAIPLDRLHLETDTPPICFPRMPKNVVDTTSRPIFLGSPPAWQSWLGATSTRSFEPAVPIADECSTFRATD